jgi:hypothetical protein
MKILYFIIIILIIVSICIFFFSNSNKKSNSINQYESYIINENEFRVADLSKSKTFNCLIATTGRKSLQNMLNSVLRQLSKKDCLTIVYDGHSTIPYFDLSLAKCKVNQYYEPVALKYWGHGIRNKYSNIMEPRDFVLHADDDDTYDKNAFNYLRQKCTNTKYIYIAKMKNGPNIYGTALKKNYIGTPCGIIPYDYNKNAKWAYEYGGDGMFYEELKSKYKNNIKFLDKVIYYVRSETYVDTSKNIYCFWTGNNKMSSNRNQCLQNIKKNSGLNIIFISPENLDKYILPNHPLHSSYKYLSETHKADYLRTYFMHFYGGAYSDIKNIQTSWIPAFNQLYEEENMYANGIKEIKQEDAANIPYDLVLHNKVKNNWEKLIQTCGFIFKKNTPFTTDWYNSMIKKMDSVSDNLKKYPSKSPQQVYSDEYPYPLRWIELLGEIFHPLCLKYQNNLLQTVPRFHKYTDYR